MTLPDTGVSSRRQQRRAVETRAALLRTATEMFSASGFDSISIRQLEEMAGVKRGLAAYHFGDKDHLWMAAVDQLFAVLIEDFVSRVTGLADVAPEEAARGFIKAFVRYSAHFPQLNRLMMQECMSDSWRVAYIVDNHVRPMLDDLTALMPEAAKLLWGSRDAHRYYLYVGASAFVFSAEQECLRLFGVSPRTEDFIEQHANLVAKILLQ